MKNLLIVIAFLSISMMGFSQATGNKTKKKVELTFDNPHINIGKVKKGEKKTFDFAFTNTGIDPIKIAIASGCDCTTLDWPRKTIKPGEKGKINVIFDSTEKEESETVDVDLYLDNLDPKTGEQMLIIVAYKFELVK